MAQEPQNAALEDELGSVYAQEGKWDDAQRAFAAALSIQPEFALGHMHLGLALAGGRPVSTGELADAVWGDDPPADLTNALQTLVSRARRALGGANAVEQSAAGYRLVGAARMPEAWDEFAPVELAAVLGESRAAAEGSTIFRLTKYSPLTLATSSARTGAPGRPAISVAAGASAEPLTFLSRSKWDSRSSPLQQQRTLPLNSGQTAALATVCSPSVPVSPPG